jgi:CspA family cold shock protein
MRTLCGAAGTSALLLFSWSTPLGAVLVLEFPLKKSRANLARYCIGRNPMSHNAKLAISLVIAIIAATLTSVLLTGQLFDLTLMVAFAIATVATALLVSSKPAADQPRIRAAAKPGTATGDRARGTVKWFNVSKGFGFIVKEDGEEIFVHFRSIRGEGRRGLRDGQRVNFIVSESDKGPQAEDVVGEE